MRSVTRLVALALLFATGASAVAPEPAAASQRPAAVSAGGTDAKAPLSAEGRYIVILKDGKSVDAATSRAGKRGVKADKTFRHAVRGYAAHLAADQLATLRSDPDVQAVVPDEVISMAAQSIPTGVRRIGGRESLIADINGDGSGVDADVAIVDTGIGGKDSRGHEDLNIAGGINCATSNPENWGDANGHGTHVAGTVGALDNGIGVVGVAPGVRLWAVRILDSAGNGLISWYVCGLDWITAQRDPLDPTRPLFEAVNMSVAKRGTDDRACGMVNNDLIHQAICRLVASGVTVVAAAGNNGFNAANLKPASYNEVITVSALADTDGKAGGTGGALCYSWGTYDRDDTFADFSNYGGDVDLIAPGKCIWSTLPGNRYGYISGTSMAAPHVAGAAALYKSSRPLATPAEVRAALRAAGTLDWNTATDPDSVHEPLLDVSRLVALGDFTLDATPGTSRSALVGGGRCLPGAPRLAHPCRGLPGRGSSRRRGEGAAHGDARLGHAGRAGPGGNDDEDRGPGWHPQRNLHDHRDGRRRDPRAGLHVPRCRGQQPAECHRPGPRPAFGIESRGRPEFRRDVGRGIGRGGHDRSLRGPLAGGRQPWLPDDAGRLDPPGKSQDEDRPHVCPAPAGA